MSCQGIVGLVAQHDLEALLAHAELRGGQAGAEHHVHLVGVQHVHDGQQRADLDLGQRFLGGFAARRVLRRLAVLHEARRESSSSRGAARSRGDRAGSCPSCSGTQPATIFGFW